MNTSKATQHNPNNHTRVPEILNSKVLRPFSGMMITVMLLRLNICVFARDKTSAIFPSQYILDNHK